MTIFLNKSFQLYHLPQPMTNPAVGFDHVYIIRHGLLQNGPQIQQVGYLHGSNATTAHATWQVGLTVRRVNCG